MEDAVKRNGEEENGESGSYDVMDGEDEEQQDLVAAYQKVLDMGADSAPLNVMQTLDDIHEEDEEQQENSLEASDRTGSATGRIKAGATLKQSGPSSLSETQADQRIPGGISPLQTTHTSNLESEKPAEKSEKDVLERQGEIASDIGSVSQPSARATLAQPKYDLRKLVERATSLYVEHYDERFSKNAAAAGYQVSNGQSFLQNCTVTIDSEMRPAPETCRFEQLQLAHIEPEKGASQRRILSRVSSLCDPDWLVSQVLHRFQQLANGSPEGQSDCQTLLCPIVLNYGQLMARIGGGSFSSSAHVTVFVTRLLRTLLCQSSAEGEQKQLTEDEFDFLVKNVLSVCAFLQANPLPHKLQPNVQLLPLVILEDVRCSYLDELHPIWTAVNEFQNATIVLLAYDYLLLDKQHECDTKRFTDFWYVRPPSDVSQMSSFGGNTGSAGQSFQLAKQHPDCCFPAALCASQKFKGDTLFALLEQALLDQLRTVAQSAQLDVALLCDILCHICFTLLSNPAKSFSEQVLIAELLRANENEQQVKQCVQALIQADILHSSRDDREEMLEFFVTPFRTYCSSAAWQQFCVARHLLRRYTAERAKNAAGTVEFDTVLRGSEQLVTVRTPVVSCDSLALFLQALFNDEKQSTPSSASPVEQFAQFVAKRGTGGRYVSSMRQFESNVLRTMFLNAVRICFDASLDAQVQKKLSEQLLTVFGLKVSSAGEALLLNLADLIELSSHTLSESLLKAVMQQLSGIKFAVRSCTSDHETEWLVDMIGSLHENCKLISIDTSSWRTKALKTNADRLFTCLLEKASKLEQFDLCLDHAFLRSYGDAFEQEARAQVAKRAQKENESAAESTDTKVAEAASVPSVELTKFTTSSSVRQFQINIRHRVGQGDSSGNKAGGSRHSNFAVFLERICITVLGEQSQVRSVTLRGCLMNRDVAKVLARHVSTVKSLETLSIGGPVDSMTHSINAVDACSGGCTEMGGVTAFSELLKTGKCREVILDLNTYGSPGMSSSNGSADYEILMASVLKALQRNENVKELQFLSRTIPHSVLETLADTIERCIALETVIIQTEKMYDLLVENLANAIICQTTLRSLKLISSRFEAFSPNALMTFIQACVFSPELKLVEVRLDESSASTPLSGFAVRLVEAALRSAEQFAITNNEAGQSESLKEPSNNTEQESNNGDADGDKNVTENGTKDENKKSTEAEQSDAEEEEDLSAGEVQVRSADRPLVIRFVGSLLNDMTKLGKRKPEEAIEQLRQNAAKLVNSSVRVELDELRM